MEKVIGIVSANYTTGDMRGMTRARTIASLPFGAAYRMIDFPLSNLVNSEITSVGLIIPLHCRSLLDHIGFGKNWKLDRKVGGLFFLPEATQRANRTARNFLLYDMKQNYEFLKRSTAAYAVLCNCHFICNLDYRPALQKMKERNADILLICGRGVRNGESCRGVRTDSEGRVILFSPRTEGDDLQFIESFIIRRELLLSLVREYDEFTPQNVFDLIAHNLSRWNVRACVHEGYVGSIATVGDYFRCSQDLLGDGAIRQELFQSPHRIHTKVYDNAPTRLHDEAQVRNCMIGSGDEIYGAVEDSVLFRNVSVGEGAVIRNSVVMPAAVIGRNAVIENVIIDKQAVVLENSVLRGSPQDPIIVGKEHSAV